MLKKVVAYHKSLVLSLKLRKYSASKYTKINAQERHSVMCARGKNTINKLRANEDLS